MTRRAIITVVTRNYAHYALALAESAREHQPDCDMFVCFADDPQLAVHARPDFLNVVLASELGIENWHRFAFQYTPFELSCALKPYAMRYLVDHGYDQVIYLDGDMRLFSPLKAVFDLLQTSSIVLTPHLIRPFPHDDARPGEDLFLMAGTFNAGFMAVSGDATGRSFLDWWAYRLKSDCFVDLSASIFVDQKWLSLVPGMFERVSLLRDPAYNTGHWTMPQFELWRDSEGRACIGKHPISLFHFSNLSPAKAGEFDHCQTRTTLAEQPILQELVQEYHQALARWDHRSYASLGCEFERMSDGTKIRPQWREAIRRNHPFFVSVDNPFDLSQHPDLPARFVSIEGKARKWRKDWRLKGIGNSPTETQSKKLEKRMKILLKTVGLRKKAA